jgi:hypothetical protein
MIQTTNHKRVLAAVAAAAALTASAAQAAPVLSDGFDTYANGNLAGQGGWTATASAATPIQVAGGADKVASLGPSGQDDYKAFTAPVANSAGTSLYTGADIHVTAAQSGSSQLGDYFLHLSNPAGTTSGFFQRLYARSVTGGYQLGLVDTSGTGSTITFGTDVLELDETYRVVLSWDFVDGANNDAFQVYVDPTGATEAVNTPYLTHAWTSATAEPTQLAAANLRQGGGSFAPTATVDDLVVSTNFAEAVAVPEPAGLALAGAVVGALGLGRRRR